ncbi:MAG: hypothetical protein GY861_07620 [bacterium]|nr:hypothetical protein [bacterium]
MSNPNPSPKNQWKPGQSGNPNGRPPKNVALSDILKELGLECIEDIETKDKKTRNELLAKVMWKKALKGDMLAINTVLERKDGKLKEHIVTEDITVHVPDQQEQQAMLDKFKYDIPSSKEEEGEDKIQ